MGLLEGRVRLAQHAQSYTRDARAWSAIRQKRVSAHAQPRRYPAAPPTTSLLPTRRLSAYAAVAAL